MGNASFNVGNLDRRDSPMKIPKGKKGWGKLKFAVTHGWVSGI